LNILSLRLLFIFPAFLFHYLVSYKF
jgi:hypothetical protein